ncbi:hypothetical protein AMTR_s00015p00226110 [Amborella trichopoda]|uniref:Uncharacterized protein n=1 Tax=Amborella trichopoda TaxID=13333 RepID=W1PMH0_AMBTC|nr:hypothetical protein AMTR_s00015p00226110 [Amborella trichopoda]
MCHMSGSHTCFIVSNGVDLKARVHVVQLPRVMHVHVVCATHAAMQAVGGLHDQVIRVHLAGPPCIHCIPLALVHAPQSYTRIVHIIVWWHHGLPLEHRGSKAHGVRSIHIRHARACLTCTNHTNAIITRSLFTCDAYRGL